MLYVPRRSKVEHLSVPLLELIYVSMAIMQVIMSVAFFAGFQVLLSVTGMLVDLSVTIMQVAASVAVMQLKVTASHDR